MAKSGVPTPFEQLKALAGANNSDDRRELLRGVTDMFLQDSDIRSDAECMLFEDVITAVVTDMESAVRAELSERLSSSDAPIHSTLRRFAMDDDINVARPVLEGSNCLSDSDLIDVVSSKTQAHIMAITKRATVSESVTDAIVDKGSDQVLSSLLDNSGAIIGRNSMEKVADRAINSSTMQRSFVGRDDVPLDLLNELVLVVEKDLRKEILDRFEGVSTQELDAAIAKSRRKIRSNYGKATREQKAAREDLNELEKKGTLQIEIILQYLQRDMVTHYAEALGRMSGIGYDNALKIYKQRDVDSLALVLKSMNVKLAMFATIAAYIAGVQNAADQVKRYAGTYREVPAESAQRAIRFWKVRSNMQEAA